MNIYTRTKKCPECQGPIFKYADVSNDTFHLICGHTTITISDVNTNGYVRKHVETQNKKQPCEFNQVYTFDELKETEIEDDDYEYEHMLLHSEKQKIFVCHNDNDNDCIESEDDDDYEYENGYDIEYEDENEEENDDDIDDNESVISENGMLN